MSCREFFVGDRVRVVDTPYYECPFSWAPGMSRYCSEEAKIIWKEYIASFKTYAYCISNDRGNHFWCGNCLILLDSDLEIEAASDDDLLEFLM